MTKITGECMCGGVSYAASTEAQIAVNCHCSNCRKSGTSGHSSLWGVPQEALAVSGKLSRYSWKADSGSKVTKHFCSRCGCLVYLENDAMPQMRVLSANLLDDPELFDAQLVVYSSRATSWDQPAAGLPSFPEMPPRTP